MGTLRESKEGFELPQTSRFLIDDIRLTTTEKAKNEDELVNRLITDGANYFWFDSHHLMDEQEEQLRNELNPWIVTYHPELSRWKSLPCPQIRWRGYKNDR